MTYVVTQPCDGCKYTDCVVVCPCECFHEDKTMLYINPDNCIDCQACAPACPVEAIFFEADVPEEWSHYTELNAEMSAKLPLITERRKPLIP